MPSKLNSLLLGGLLIGILSTSYLGFINMACCAGVILGAMAGVWHYTNENDLTIPPGTGAGMGVMMGIIGSLVALALNYVVGLVGLPDSEAISQQIQQMFMGGGEMTPEQEEAMEAMQDQANNPAFRAMQIGIGFVVTAIFGAIGGAIGAAVFKKGEE